MNLKRRSLALCLIYFFLVNLAGCGGGGGGSEVTTPTTDGDGSDVSTPALNLQQELTNFNTSSENVTLDMVSIIKTAQDLETAIELLDYNTESTILEVGATVDQFDAKTTSFLTNVAAMNQAEEGIQQLISATSAHTAILPALIGAALVIKGLYSFGQKMKGYSNDLSSARKELEDSQQKIMNNDTSGSSDPMDDRDKARKKMNEAGTKAVQELGSKVATDLVFTGVNPTTVAGVILSDALGNNVQEGLIVVSSTEECKTGYETSGCTLGVNTTNDTYPAKVPSGKTTVVVSGGNNARTVITDINFPADANIKIVRKEISVSEATPDAINQNVAIVAPDNGTLPDPITGSSWQLAEVISYTDPFLNSNACYQVSVNLSDGSYDATTSVSDSVCNWRYSESIGFTGSWTSPPDTLIPGESYAASMNLSRTNPVDQWTADEYIYMNMDKADLECGYATASQQHINTESVAVGWRESAPSSDSWAGTFEAPALGYAGSSATKKFQIIAGGAGACMRYIYEWVEWVE